MTRGDDAAKAITNCGDLRDKVARRIFFVRAERFMTDTFYIKAKWDEEAKVYYSETNVPGLSIEADTLKSFLEMVEDLAPQMLEANLPLQSVRQVKLSGLELAIAC
jgi:hypothetical protein